MSAPVFDPLAHRGTQPARRDGSWGDRGPLDPSWKPPKPNGRLPRWVVVTVLLALVAALVVIVGAAGGFARRSDRIVRVPLSTTITSGEYRLTFATATAEQSKDLDDSVIWKVKVYGTIATTGASSDTPGTDVFGFILAQSPLPPREAKEITSLDVGSRLGSDYSTGQVTPGLPPVPVVYTIEFAKTFVPTAQLRVVVYHQRYYDNTLLQDGGEEWNPTATADEVLVPLTVVRET